MENRVIKFRAFNPATGDMLYSHEAPTEPSQLGAFFLGISLAPLSIIMQFTGLNDKNGKEIYEGDVIKTIWESNDPTDELIEIEKVIFKDGAFWVGEYYLSETNEDCEIIGNIHQNPDLLTIIS